MRSSLPCFDGSWVIDTDCPVVLDNSAATLGVLPLQGVASQRLVRSTRPHKPPKIRLSCPTLTILNPNRHLLEFIPRLRRAPEPVLFKKISSVIQNTNIGMKRHSDQTAIDSIIVQ